MRGTPQPVNLSALVACATIGLILLLSAPPRSESATGFDPWVHPRGESYDAKRHYRDAQGDLYFHAENDLHQGLGQVIVGGADRRYVSVELGRDLFAVLQKSGGMLHPVLHYDTNGDGSVDRTIVGRVEDTRAIFDAPGMERISFSRIHWQIGVQYRAETSGNAALDRRYLASVDSGQARVEFKDGADLADVGAGPFGPGLVILKFREGNPFDLADFVENPNRYTESFDALTRDADGDDWTVEEDEGRLVTHFDERDLFLVRTTGDMRLEVEWGDMPMAEFMDQYLHVTQNGNECYSSLHANVVNEDGTPVQDRLLLASADQWLDEGFTFEQSHKILAILLADDPHLVPHVLADPIDCLTFDFQGP